MCTLSLVGYMIHICIPVLQLPGADDLPAHLFDDITDISYITDTAEAYVNTACPAGIKKCECMNAPGKDHDCHKK